MKWYERNRDKALLAGRLYRQANKWEHAKSVRRWTIKHAETKRAQNRASYERNKASVFERGRLRRAVKMGRTIAAFTASQLNDRMAACGGTCVYCGGPFQEIDHAIPLSRGGMHCLANLRPACTPCNRAKWARTPREFDEYRRQINS